MLMRVRNLRRVTDAHFKQSLCQIMSSRVTDIGSLTNLRTVAATCVGCRRWSLRLPGVLACNHWRMKNGCSVGLFARAARYIEYVLATSAGDLCVPSIHAKIQGTLRSQCHPTSINKVMG